MKNHNIVFNETSISLFSSNESNRQGGITFGEWAHGEYSKEYSFNITKTNITVFDTSIEWNCSGRDENGNVFKCQLNATIIPPSDYTKGIQPSSTINKTINRPHTNATINFFSEFNETPKNMLGKLDWYTDLIKNNVSRIGQGEWHVKLNFLVDSKYMQIGRWEFFWTIKVNATTYAAEWK